MGNIEYPCYEVSMTLEKEKEANIRMNKNTGSWDFDLLGSEFTKDELETWGWDSELDDIFGRDVGDGDGSGSENEEEKILSLKYSLHDYDRVMAKLKEKNESPEIGLLMILGL